MRSLPRPSVHVAMASPVRVRVTAGSTKTLLEMPETSAGVLNDPSRCRTAARTRCWSPLSLRHTMTDVARADAAAGVKASSSTADTTRAALTAPEAVAHADWMNDCPPLAGSAAHARRAVHWPPSDTTGVVATRPPADTVVAGRNRLRAGRRLMRTRPPATHVTAAMPPVVMAADT